MSNREKCLALLDAFSEQQLSHVALMLQAALEAVAEAQDEAFCAALYKEYLADPDRGEAVSLEDVAVALGVEL